MTEPAKPAALADLAKQINAAHAAITRYGPVVVRSAIEAGHALKKAKDQHTKHGEWLSWLEVNCPDVTERTAQLYMQLAKGETTLDGVLKSATGADLTLKEAARLVSSKGSKGDKASATPSVAYNNAAKKLLEKLKALALDDTVRAEEALAETIKRLKETIETVTKAVAAGAAKKAA